MSARKPLARMDSPATTESIDEVVPATDGVTVEAVSKTVPIENGGESDKTSTITTTTQTEKKEQIQIKEEQLDVEETGFTGSQKDSIPVNITGTESTKRSTRNSPMLVASPLKKKPSDSQEQDSSAESNSATDEAPKKNDKPIAVRSRKQSDTNNKSSSNTVLPTNRLTRKAAAQDWAANTRLTRARRTSAGIGTRSETPPKRKYVLKKNTDPPAPAVKRKRSVSPKPSTEEPESKIIKSEEQDTDFDMNTITVKQEILESSEDMTSDVASDITEPFAVEPTSRISLRARKSAMCYSPSTRQYRRDKDKEKSNAEANVSDSKRKRLSRVRPDEDSKDSMASSIIEDLVDVKVEEKFQPEDDSEAVLAEPTASNACASPTTVVDTVANGTTDSEITDRTDIIDLPIAEDNTASINLPFVVDRTESIDLPLTIDTTESVDLPLTVDTTESISDPETQSPSTSTAAVVSEQAISTDKAASLSPEMVSEGVSEISVKQFYKKAEFLENNLGIEKDPKLGEIVQNVAEKMDDTVDTTSVSNESIKEGELLFEDDEVTSIGSIRNENPDEEDDDEVNSVSTGFISPLIVEEEDEEEEEEVEVDEEIEVQSTLNGEDEKVQKLSEGDELQLSEEKNGLEIVEEEITKELDSEVFSGNGSVKEIIESNSEDKSMEKVKSESCDKTLVDDIEQKVVSKKEENAEDEEEKPQKMEDSKSVKKLVPELKSIEKKEEIIGEIVELMNVDEPKTEEVKIEEDKIDEIITDHEENKENLELGAESVKEDMQEMTETSEKENASMSTDNQNESPSESSKTISPNKNQGESSGEATTPSTSPQSSKSSSVPRTPENDERLRQKERHLKTLGLLTHKAADEAIMAKQKRRKFLHNLSNNSGSKKNSNPNAATSSGGSAAGNAQNKSSHEYTGTLKTVIKLNRQSGGGAGGGAANEPKKGKNVEASTKAVTSGCGSRRQSLKMTFQKGRGRPANPEKSGENPANTSGEDSYYTIQNEGDGTIPTAPVTGDTTSTMATAATTTTHGRKSYNRSNTIDATHHAEYNDAPTTSKKDEKEEILIPEKASSFKFHPGRLCQDQCYYCSGKFGLYDTPCHVGQIKSVERQQKILNNEEKLTVDNCLCDACFRHVDRRANVPSYKKRLSAPGHIETVSTNTTSQDDTSSEQEKTQQKSQQHSHANGPGTSSSHTCAVPDCNQIAAHSLRRKGIRKSVKKSLLNFDMSTAGTYLHICEKHYEQVVQSSGCVLCKRRLGKNNMYHITTDTDRLEKALANMGIPVTLGQGTAVCKLCRYFANLLMKPPEHGKVQKVEFVKNYRKRLLQFYNIHEKKDTSHEENDEDKDKDKEKTSSKKQTASSSGKRTTRKSRTSNENEEESKEPIEEPPSPVHSTGSSVEMISDGGAFNNPDSPKQIPTTSAASATPASSNQMVLDNDVMVDYDVPMISDSSSSASSKSTSPSPQRIKPTKDQQSKLKAILQNAGTSLEDRNDISTVLRSNPNISMRELFPGEEDLGLQFKAPFGGSSSQRTPEGWTRINTFLQYDEPTRRLWEDLQKPYGNQSSFLRHLILLEKYYRNGDLILSSNASSNATVYTQTVSNRLQSYDSRSSSPATPSKEMERRSRSLSVDKIQRQLSSNSVTITARPKEPKPPQKEAEAPKPKDGASTSAGVATSTPTPNSRSILKTNLIGSKGGAVEIVQLPASNSSSNSPHSSSGSTTPNDNLLLTKQQKILAAANKLMSNKLEASPNQKKASLNTTPPELISLNRRPVPALNSQQMKRTQLLPKPMNSAKPIPPNVVVLPDTLTVQERAESKSWRPTLLPVTTSSHHLNNQQGPLYQTADGRRLPALVQVQSGGSPFLISIHDYNRMCILRREKLMRDQMLKGGKGKVKGPIFPPATCVLNNGGRAPTTTNAALQSFNKTMHSVTSIENAAKKQRLIMSKPANFTPIAPKPAQTTTATTLPSSTRTSQQQQSQSSQPTVILPAGTLQPLGILSSAQSSALSILPNFTGHVLPILNPNTSTTSTATTSGVPTNSWLWNNFPEIPDNQMLINGKATAAKGPPQATFTPMKQQSLLLDNSLMSKIPKSLTVIPQHKLMPAPSGASGNKSKD